MPNRRTRKTGSSGKAVWSRRLALVLLAGFFLLGVLFPTGAFSLVETARTSSLDVAGDRSAELGLDVSNCVERNTITPLVTVTDNLQESVEVTVSLLDSTQGTLYADGKSGSSVTFTIGVGSSVTVDMEASAGGPYPRTFDFRVQAVGTDTTVSAVRSSQVETNCGPSTPTPTATVTPDPNNQPPIADFTMSRQGSQHVNVDASSSSDPDGTIVSYEWDVGADGTIEATGQTARLRASPGTQVKLIVTDNDGATNSTTKTAP